MEVVGPIMTYIQKIKSEGVREWYWNEMKESNRIEFDWIEKKKAQGYVE